MSSRIPTVCLGKVHSSEMDYYNLEESDEIKIWYAKNIKPESNEHPIIIDVRKIFLGQELTISGAHQYLVTGW